MGSSRVIAQTAGAWRDYFELTKPRVVSLMIVTSIVGMCLATKSAVPWHVLILGNIGIALSAGSAAVINHMVDRHIDAVMMRTQRRPIAAGRVSPQHALLFALLLGCSGILILSVWINKLTAFLTFLTLIGYAGVYTLYLKRATPQNIVIGGLAGAAPPLLGWVAVTGSLDPQSLLLVLLIFVWTPPHFWALAIHRKDEYAKANIPMLPATHGIQFTKVSILLYTILLTAISLFPYIINMSSGWYAIGALLLDMVFLYWASMLLLSRRASVAIKTFRYSIFYLFALFVLLLVDHYLKLPG